VILLGRDREPVGDRVRTVMGIKGEPTTPKDPAQGLVWSAILSQVDRAGSESEWVSVSDTSRETFARHPWSIGGGGAAELRDALDTSAAESLAARHVDIGFLIIAGKDNCLLLEPDVPARIGLSTKIPIGDGEALRDWTCENDLECLWPYDPWGKDLKPEALSSYFDFLWPYRTTLKSRKAFGVPVEQKGLRWWDIREVYRERLKTSLSIPFAFVATHNHFVLDRGGKVFNRSAPVIKLPAGATEDDHLALIGLLNSSTACFWMKQVFHNKGSTVDTKSARQTTDAFENFYEFTGTGLKQFPVTEERPLDLARELDRLARERRTHLPAQLADQLPFTRADPDAHHAEAECLLRRMIALQKELDWRCYRLYGITKDELTMDPASVPEMDLGERAFEILMARKMAAGELTTTWFERHRSKPITRIPAHWPEDYRRLVERRIALIEADRNVGLIERPEYKRRWNQEPWEAQEQRALRGWLMNRLEIPACWPDLEFQTTRRLADRAGRDSEFMQVAEVYRGHPDFDVHPLVAELVESEAVPFFPVLRYKPTGLRKREVWERTWDLQRREDAIDAEVEANPVGCGEERTASIDDANGAVRELTAPYTKASIEEEQHRREKQEIGDIPPPPKYRSADFLNTTFWRLRGALDVPKERFVSYPHCSKAADPSLVIAWAGWDHL
jgi:hypothetical protein